MPFSDYSYQRYVDERLPWQRHSGGLSDARSGRSFDAGREARAQWLAKRLRLEDHRVVDAVLDNSPHDADNEYLTWVVTQPGSRRTARGAAARRRFAAAAGATPPRRSR